MRCAIYCRLSREDEEKLSESESIQNQKSLLLNYASEQQWIVYQVYSDEDYSGADRTRPEFNQMIRDAKKGLFDLILCKTQSRFTRDMELVERYIHGLFPLWGIRFVAIADHIDTALQGNKKARQINGLVNEWYLEDLSENIRMVLNHKREQGLHIGGFPLYGYQKHPTEKGHLCLDPNAATVVRQIFSWALEGHGKQEIANLLNQQGIPNPTKYKQEQGYGYVNGSTRDDRGLWNRSSVGRILQNEMYLGTMVQGTHRKLSYKSPKLLSVPKEEWFRVENTHAPIIDKDTFLAVQSLHQSRRKTSGDGEIHPLAGLVKCMICGKPMQKNSYTYKGERRNYLRCMNQKFDNSKATHHTCSVQLDKLLFLVEEQIRIFFREWYCSSKTLSLPEPTYRSQKQDMLARKHALISTQLTQRISALESLYLDKVTGLVTPKQFQELSAAFSHEIETFRQQKVAYEKELSIQQSESNSHDSPKKSIAKLLSGPIPRTLFMDLIQQIEVQGKDKESGTQTIKIVWKF